MRVHLELAALGHVLVLDLGPGQPDDPPPSLVVSPVGFAADVATDRHPQLDRPCDRRTP